MRNKIVSLCLILIGLSFISKAQDPCSNNGDLEFNNTSVWRYSVGSTGGYPISAPTPSAGSLASTYPGKFAITNISSDAFAWFSYSSFMQQNDHLVPGSHSLRIGDNLPSTGSAKASYVFTVPTDFYQLQYDYALVLTKFNPIREHDSNDQSNFEVIVKDLTTASEITCAGLHLLPTSPGMNLSLISPPSGETYVMFKDWSSVNIDLTGRIGHQISVEFGVSDCIHSEHLGYAYVNLHCDQREITVAKCHTLVGSSSTLTLPTLPSGYSSCQWYAMPGMTPLTGATGLTLPITVPTTNQDWICKVTSSTGLCNIYYTYHVVIDASPNAGSLSTSGNICGVGNITTLTNVGGDAGGSWSCTPTSIADIAFISGATATVTGNGIGTATVSYTVTNSCGTASTSTTVEVHDAVNAEIIYISGDPDVFCTGVSYTYYIHGTPGATVGYTLTNSDGTAFSAIIILNSTGTGYIPVTPPVPGIVTLDLNSITFGPCTSPLYSTQVMPVFSAPVAGVLTGPDYICGIGNTISLTDVGGDAGGIWTTSNSGVADPFATSSTGFTTPVTATGVGTATISYTVVSQCGIAHATKTIDVYDGSDASIVYISGDPDVFCAGVSYTYYINGTPGATVGYTLTNSDGTAFSAIIILNSTGTGYIPVTPPVAGTVILTLNSITVGPCIFPLFSTQSMPVLTAPVAGVVTGPDHICGIGNSIVLTALGGDPGGTWMTGDFTIANPTGTSSITTPVVSIGTGITNISYTVSNKCGGETSMMPIEVFDASVWDLLIFGDPDYLCKDQPYTYYIVGTPGADVGYTVSYSSGSSGISYSGTVTIGSSSIGYVPVIPTATGVMTFSLSSITLGPCTFPLYLSQPMNVVDCINGFPTEQRTTEGSKIDIKQQNGKITIVPNPSNGNFSIEQSLEKDASLSVKITDAVGRVVYDKPTLFEGGISKLDASNFPSGLYLVEVTDTKGQRLVTKLVIEK